MSYSMKTKEIEDTRKSRFPVSLWDFRGFEKQKFFKQLKFFQAYKYFISYIQ